MRHRSLTLWAIWLGVVAAPAAAVLAGSPPQFPEDQAPVLECAAPVAAYDLDDASRQKGLFPAGARLEVIEQRVDGMLHVRFRSPSGRVVQALCRAADLAPPAPEPVQPAPAAPAPAPEPVAQPAPQPAKAADYEGAKWLKDRKGYEEARELQMQTRARILIFVLEDNCDQARLLEKDLFDEDEFETAFAGVIKVSINTSHGAEEQKLAGDLGAQGCPAILVQDAPGKRPRRISLIGRIEGKLKADTVEVALAKVLVE